MLTNYKTLILNTDGNPLTVVDWWKAIGLVYVKKHCYQIDFYKNTKIKDSKGISYNIPAVIMVKKYVKRPNLNPTYRKSSVFIRDNFTCQYCGKIGDSDTLTIDHVIPRCKWKGKGSVTNWNNVVAACYRCNNTKGDKTPQQAGMPLRKAPQVPKHSMLFQIERLGRNTPKEWKQYLNECQTQEAK